MLDASTNSTYTTTKWKWWFDGGHNPSCLYKKILAGNLYCSPSPPHFVAEIWRWMHQYFSQKAVTNIACPRLRDLLTLSRLLLRKASHVWRFVCNTCSLKLGLPTRRRTRMIIFSTERTKDTSIPSSNPKHKHKHKTQQPQQLSPSSKPNIDTSL